MNGWVDGRMDVKAILRIAHTNQKCYNNNVQYGKVSQLNFCDDFLVPSEAQTIHAWQQACMPMTLYSWTQNMLVEDCDLES